jgi:hypothetical protein
LLSICIPIFNYGVSGLVYTLHKQCIDANVVFEFVLIDDASAPYYKEYNAHLNTSLTYINYIQLPQNIGRAAIRNMLASKSKYPHLLFMDCDSMPNSNTYIQNYIRYCNTTNVVYGGRIYNDDAISIDHYLHWLYGKRREVKTAEQRQANPYISFLSNNFLVHKAIITKYPFDENIIQYGHEDTLWAMVLKQNLVTITHINNPLNHVGLDGSEDFIAKTKLGVQNLKNLQTQHSKVFNEVKLIRYASAFKKYKLKNAFVFVVKHIEHLLLKDLKSVTPSLYVLDILKLYWLLIID